MDGYNWGKTPVNPHPWKTFTEIFDPTYKLLTTKVAPKKPVLLGELATSPYGGHKAAWIRDMLAKLPVAYPRVRGFVYFDGIDRGIEWPIESSVERDERLRIRHPPGRSSKATVRDARDKSDPAAALIRKTPRSVRPIQRPVNRPEPKQRHRGRFRA